MNERVHRAARKKWRWPTIRLLAIFVLPLLVVLVAPVMAGGTWTPFSYVFIYLLLVIFMALNDLRSFVIPAIRDRRASHRQKAS